MGLPIPTLNLSCSGREHRTNPERSIASPGQETPLASGVSTNVSVDVDSRQHDPEQDQDQPAFNRQWNNQYAVLTELDIKMRQFRLRTRSPNKPINTQYSKMVGLISLIIGKEYIGVIRYSLKHVLAHRSNNWLTEAFPKKRWLTV
eukprot:scaffold17086_cov140-Amphora_coffeaeformis.AAC.1